MFKYTLRIKTTFLETLQNQKGLQRLDFGNTTYNDFVLARSEYLRNIGAPNESLRLIILYYMFKYTFGTKTTLLESLQNQKKTL